MKFYVGVTDNNWYHYLSGLKPEENNLNAKLAKSQVDYADRSHERKVREERIGAGLQSSRFELIVTTLRALRLNVTEAS